MILLKELVQGSTEWHNFRQQGIGASEASVLLNISPFKKIDTLFFEKIGELKDLADNIYMAKGRELEPIARQKYEESFGVFYQPMCAIHEEHSFLRASFDGINFDKKHLIEIKCPGEKTFELSRKGIIPDHYQAQLQYQLLVSGYDLVDYVCYFEGQMEVIPVWADKEYQNKLLEKAKWFWNCVLTRKPPGNPENDELTQLFEEYEKLYNLQKQVEERMESIKGILKDVIPEDKPVSWGNLLGRWTERTGTIDYKSIPILETINLEDYRKPPTKNFEMRYIKPKTKV